MDFVIWSGESNDAADSTAADLDDLEAEPTGDHAIIDWYRYENQGVCRFPLDASAAEQDGPVWTLVAYMQHPDAEDYVFEALHDPATVGQCRKVADRLGISGLLGD